MDDLHRVKHPKILLIAPNKSSLKRNIDRYPRYLVCKGRFAELVQEELDYEKSLSITRLQIIDLSSCKLPFISISITIN